MNTPLNNVILCGYMGAGKSTIGNQLAKIMSMQFIDTDELIEKKNQYVNL